MIIKPALLPVLVVLALSLPALTPSARAQVAGSPALIDYQGTIFDGSSGNPLGSSGSSPNFAAAPANYTMQFKIFDQQTAGSLIWAETQTVTVSLGNFSVRLGSGAPIAGLSPAPVQTSLASSFNTKERYLEVTAIIPPAATGTPITPRLAFQSSPFALVAERAKLADTATLANSVNGVVTATAGSTFAGTVSGTSSGTFSGAVTATSGSFTGNGSGITTLNAGNVSSGTLSDFRLSSNVALLNRSNQTFAGSLGATTGLFAKLGINGSSSNVTEYLKGAAGDDFLLYGVNSAGTNVFYVYNEGSVYAKGGMSTNGSLTVNGGHQLNINGSFGNYTSVIQARPTTDAAILGLNNSAGTTLFYFLTSGVAVKPGGGSWAAPSDARLKANIQNVEGSLDKLLSLRSVTFDYKDRKKYGAGRQTGFIAQEVEKVFPEWVSEGEDHFKILAVSGFESLAVQALRELREEKDQQIKIRDQQIAGLTERLADIANQGKSRDERLARLEELLPRVASAPAGIPAPSAAPELAPVPVPARLAAPPSNPGSVAAKGGPTE